MAALAMDEGATEEEAALGGGITNVNMQPLR